jgi:hypothetical protein
MKKIKIAGFRAFFKQLDFQHNREAASQSVIGSGCYVNPLAPAVSVSGRLTGGLKPAAFA